MADALGKRRQFGMILEWITGGYHPPDLIQLAADQRCLAHMEVAFMRRVERSAKQADALATLHMGKPHGFTQQPFVVVV